MQNWIIILMVLTILIVLQVFLSKQKNKWLGLAIPTINIVVVLSYVFNDTAASIEIIDFVLMLIPAAINLIIYFVCRKNIKRNLY